MYPLVVFSDGLNLSELHARVDQYVKLLFHPSVSAKDQYMVLQDLEDLHSFGIEGGKIESFPKVFGGTDALAVLKYLDERLQVILPWNTKVITNILAGVDHNSNPNVRPKVMATNESVSMWLQSLKSPSGSEITIHNQQLKVESTRIGVFRLGEGYNQENHPIVRIGTLIHEARHSDCTGGLSQGDFEIIKNDPRTFLNLAPQCGHLHIPCPSNHILAGYPACDGHAWGAYGVAGLFMLALANYCEDCSDKERYIAQVTAIDNFMRVQHLEEMILQVRPNMSSGGLRP